MTNKVNTEKTLEPNFSLAYQMFHPVVRRRIKAEITEATGWSRITFYNKKNGVFPIKPLEETLIQVVFERYGVCAWTAETMNTTIIPKN